MSEEFECSVTFQGKAEQMTLGAYNTLRGWQIPADENPDSPGYLFTREGGTLTWMPAEAFDKAVHKPQPRPMVDLNFGQAIAAAKQGFKITRKGWNGCGMFVVLMEALYLPPFNSQDTNRKVNDRTAKWIGQDKPLDSQPYFAMFTAQGKWQPGWLCSQADMLASDWMIID